MDNRTLNKADLRRAIRDELGSQLETLQALAGERGPGSGALRAVRRGDVSRVGAIALTSAHVTSAPTVADFNKVVDDIKALAALIERMAAAFQG